MDEQFLAERLRDAIEAAVPAIEAALKVGDLPSEQEGKVLLEAVLKLQEPKLSLELVREAAKAGTKRPFSDLLRRPGESEADAEKRVTGE